MTSTQETENQKWVTASPLDKYSSLHELSLSAFLGWNLKWPKDTIYIELCSNLHTPPLFLPQADLTIHLQDADKPPVKDSCSYSLVELMRWRIDLKPFVTFEDYTQSLTRWHRCNYEKSGKVFKNYGAQIKLFEKDWSIHVPKVFQLYSNVAKHYKNKIYDINFFYQVARKTDWKLLSVWFHDEMIGMFLIQDESPTLHAGCGGFDYNHSSGCYAYSWLNYELIRMAIESKYQYLDAGLMGDESKRRIGYQAIPSRMDIYAKGLLAHDLFLIASFFTRATINADSSLRFGLSLGKSLR